ncbi:hypothetical protein Droror1_Dr00003182 [Drosera rotundifolia]
MSKRMSNRPNNVQQLDLKLNLSPPTSGRRHVRSPETSSSGSCVSSDESLNSSPEAVATSMVLVGCPRCLMYVMLSESDPRCPKCKSSGLLDLLRCDGANRNGNNKKNTRK